MKDERSINLGSVYENVVAQELKAHGHALFYYDNAKKGEVDYLVNNVAGMTVLPIEVKSGKDYTSHKALDRFLADKEYNIPSGIVLDNEREVYTKDNVTYMPIYFIMCIERAEKSPKVTAFSKFFLSLPPLLVPEGLAPQGIIWNTVRIRNSTCCCKSF